MSRIRALFLIPLVAVFATLGCGSGNSLAPSSISGEVSLNGKPVTGGSVMFFTEAGKPAYTASIGTDGTYAISDLPMGDLIVCVETESVNPVQAEAKAADAKRAEKQMGMGDRARVMGGGSSGGSGGSSSETNAAKYVKINGKYAKPQTSPLTFTAKSGRNVFNIELQ